jgi:hypothetical protein
MFNAAVARLEDIPETELSPSGQPFVRECADAIQAFAEWFGEQSPEDLAIVGNAHRVQYALSGLSGVIDWIALRWSTPFANELASDVATLVEEADRFDDAVVQAYRVPSAPHELRLKRRPLPDHTYAALEQRICEIASLARCLGQRLHRVAIWSGSPCSFGGPSVAGSGSASKAAALGQNAKPKTRRGRRAANIEKLERELEKHLLPVLTEEQRITLLDAAWELNEWAEPVEPPTPPANISDRPGDEFNRRADPRDVLRRHGWTLVRGGDNEYWRRPGKADGCSATLKDGVFYVFSTNAAPFEPNRAYAPFAVYALLEHGGDFTAAALALSARGYASVGIAGTGNVDLSAFGDGGHSEREPPAPPLPDPGPLPDELLRVPGFVGEVMDYCLATAPYPNPVMAFCGALALQAFLAGRRVRDAGDNRTNIYLLGLAHSAAGKDWPRKVNTRIVHEVGLAECLGDRFASGEGVQDALFVNPCMLFQTDEIDGMLQSINKAKDARHENVMGTLLTMYSASNSVFPMRRKAGKASPGVIDQPNLVIFGTAIPNHYYEALSERMLTNGFFARMVILESRPRCKGQEPRIVDVPERVIETARWWAEFRPGRGNLQDWHPVPQVIEATDEAQTLLVETREEAEAEYARAESAGDPVGTTVWGRVSEQARKLALLHAVSADHRTPSIDAAAVRWATRFVLHQTRRMLYMAAGHVAENPFHAECLRLVRKLRESPDRQMARNKLMRLMHCKAADFDQIVGTLLQQGDIVLLDIPTKTKTAQGYRLP